MLSYFTRVAAWETIGLANESLRILLRDIRISTSPIDAYHPSLCKALQGEHCTVSLCDALNSTR